jgi:predicted O-methyltransferase YrrM
MVDHVPTLTLIGKSIRNPARALRRTLQWLRIGRLNKSQERDLLLDFLADQYGADKKRLLESYEDSGLRARMRRKHAELNRFPGPYRLGATPEFDCESLFFLVRAVKPRAVVETGVCYGVSSAYVLEALNHNGRGELHSIDLGNEPDEPPSDFFIPRRLKHRWHLVQGDSKRELPRVLDELGQIDLFHHDSLHTFEHMTWEYETALPHLSPGGALSSHDVRSVLSLTEVFGSDSDPFAAFCQRRGLRFVESYNMGVAIRGPRRRRRQPFMALSRSVTDRSP